MKTVDPAVLNALKKDYTLNAQPRLLAEWNMNRYFAPLVDNDPAEQTYGFDIERFPINSIVNPIRPFKGINKARVDEAAVTDLDRPMTSRYYITSEKDVYNYWTSPEPTDGSGNFSTTTVRPYVIYSQDVKVNKIVIKIENFWASPNVFYIKTTAESTYSFGSFTTIATSPTINKRGEIVLYYNGTSWSTNKPSSLKNPPLTTIRGLMIDVRSMTAGRDLNNDPSGYALPQYINGGWSESTVPYSNGTNVFFNLIELSARREVDISDNLISLEDEFDVSDSSDLYPIGTLTTNGGNLTLSNIYSGADGVGKSGYFDNYNTDSPYYGIIQPNVLFNLEYIYTVNNATYSVQQFRLYGEEWMGQKTEEVSVSLSDMSKFFEEVTPPPALYENLTTPQLFQRVLDVCGFTDWVLDDKDRAEITTIPIFWISGEQNIWQILDELAKGTQTAIYFDSWGQLQIKTRNAAFDTAKNPTWTLKGEDSAEQLADIINLSEDGDVGTNHFTVNYQSTNWDNWNDGAPSMQKVWEPDSSVVLNSSPIIENMLTTHNYFRIPPSHAAFWPFTGKAQIEGEIVKYDAKEYVYWTGPNADTPNVVALTSQDHFKQVNELTPARYQSKNYFTGSLVLDPNNTGEWVRGIWNSEVKNHMVSLSGYDVRRVKYPSNGGAANINLNTPGIYHSPSESLMLIRPANDVKGFDATIATVGQSTDSAWTYLGAKIKTTDALNEHAGVVFNFNGTQNGYFAALEATGTAGPVVELYSVANGVIYPINKVGMALAQDTFYELDVEFKVVGTTHQINVFVDGRIKIQAYIPQGSALRNAPGGKFGTFIRGRTAASVEYLYGIGARYDLPDLPDDSTFFNLKKGGYTGGFWDREWVYGWKTRKIRNKNKKWVKEQTRWNQFYFDEFGPYAHEIREFEVKFDPAPVQMSRLYSTNDWYSIVPSYRSSPFGANFIMTNTSRAAAVVNGEDPYSFGPSNPVNQVLTVIGRALVFADAQTVVAQNPQSIRVRGKIETELQSKWIQNKPMAEEISNWMNSHWSNGLDVLTVEIFGNPLIELTDVVAVTYAKKNMDASTHKYFVTAVRTNFENGITTELSLRRVNGYVPQPNTGL